MGTARRMLPLTSSGGTNTQMHDMWLQVASLPDYRPDVPRPQKQSQTPVGGKMSDSERRAYLAERRRLRSEKSPNKLGVLCQSTADAKSDYARDADAKDKAKDKPAAVGSVGTGFVYALTCPAGRKYVGKTQRTLTQRNGSGPIVGGRLIREAIKREGGVAAFKTEVLVCCAHTSLEANEQLYIDRLGTYHPGGYNEDPKVDSDADGRFRRGGESKYESLAANGADGSAASAYKSTANAREGKEFLDAAMGGRIDDLIKMAAASPSIIHFRGAGLGQTALHWSCAKGHLAAVKWLLSHGAQIEARNQNGSTPLHAAAAAGSTEVALRLIEAGASVTVVDGEGRNCERLAEARGHERLSALLRRKHLAVTDAASAAASAAAAAAYAAAAADRREIIPIVSPVETVIAEGLVSLAIAEDIVGADEAETDPKKEGGGKEGGGKEGGKASAAPATAAPAPANAPKPAAAAADATPASTPATSAKE